MVETQPKAAGYEQFIEQKITQQATIAAGATGTISVTVPTNGKAFLKGYGYSYFATSTYTLRAGSFVMPSRTDQEGSISIPVIYGNPFPVNSGEKMELTIVNGGAAAHTYDVVFYIISNRIIPTPSVGGELILATGGSGSAIGGVVVYDSAFATSANVTAKGLDVHSTAPATLLAGTLTTSAGTATALGATTACHKLDIQVDSASGDNVYIGNSTSQPILLAPTQSITIQIDDIAKVFIKRPAATNVTVNYIGS